MAELKNLIVNGVARVNGDAYVSDMIYGTASNAISAAYAPYTNTDRYVNSAAFASTGSNGANGVKMTLTRAGSDTATVVATIPVVSATAAGVVTGTQFKKWETGSNWVGANSASLATTITNNHTHSNKAVLDGITAADTASWDAKQAAISDLATIRNNAASGSVAFGWGNHASAGYVKSSGVTSYTLTTSSDYVTVDSAAAVTSTGTRKIDLTTKSKNAINWVIANSGSAATAITNNHTHSNKAVLDGITAADTASWDGKWTYNEATIKAVKVNSASRADSAASATTATKLVGTSGSTSIPVYINAGVPTVCAGTVVSTTDRNTWTTASIQADAAVSGYGVPFRDGDEDYDSGTYYLSGGIFYNISFGGGSGNIILNDDDEYLDNGFADGVYSGVSPRAIIWGGIIRPNGASVSFAADSGRSILWSENTVEFEQGGVYEFNIIAYSRSGSLYGIITKYSES